MTIILLKLFLCFFVSMIFASIIELHEAHKYTEYFCYFLMVGAMIFFIATICSFIWFI